MQNWIKLAKPVYLQNWMIYYIKFCFRLKTAVVIYRAYDFDKWLKYRRTDMVIKLLMVFILERLDPNCLYKWLIMQDIDIEIEFQNLLRILD